MTPEQQYQAWMKRIDRAEKVMDEERTRVWQPLYDALCGGLLRRDGGGAAAADPANRHQQMLEMLLPNWMGNDRDVQVRVQRINLHREDAEAKLEMARMLGDQATALAHAIGLYRNSSGGYGELAKCYLDACWGMGVMVFGFEAPRGAAAAPQEPGGEEDDKRLDDGPVDLDRAESERHELQDPGTPWARSYSPDRVLFDPTFSSIEQAQWFAVKSTWKVREAKARWPQWAERWTASARPVETMYGKGGEQAGDGDDATVTIYYVYTLGPLRRIALAEKDAGPAEPLETVELNLGIEGLPVLALGAQWLSGRMYPRPFLASSYGAGKAELDFLGTVRGSGEKIRTMTLVRKDGELAKQVRNGDPDGVYTVDSEEEWDRLIKTMQVGGVSPEFARILELLGINWERDTGVSDMNLGRNERGQATATEINQRAAGTSARQAYATEPVRLFEAGTIQRVMSIAYANLELMDGQAFVAGAGPELRLAAFDAAGPQIGEILDYAFSVQVSNRLTDADEAQAIQGLGRELLGMEPYLQAQGHTVNAPALAKLLARKTGAEGAGELVVPLPQQPAAPQEQQQPADPAAELQQLYAALEQLPEGDPQEEQIVARIAELTQMMQGVAA